MKCKLKDLGIVSTGNTPSKSNEAFYDAENIGFIKPDALSDCRVTEKIKTTEYISENARSKARIVGKGTVFVTCIGSIGKIGLADKEFAFNQQINAIQPNERVISKYLAYCMLFNKKSLQTIANAPVVPIINKSQFEEFEVEVEEDKEKQKKVVEVLDKLVLIIKERENQLLQLDNLIKSRFVEMFGDTVTNPLGWEEHILDEYIDFLTSGSRGWAQYFVDEENELFITIKNVKNNHITLDNIQYIKAPDNKEAERTKVKAGDLLISITADLGRTGVVDNDIAQKGAYINQHLSLVRLDRDRINPLYVSYFLETEGGKIQFESKNQNGVKAGLNFDAIKSLKILVPPLEIQEAYLEFVHQTNKLKSEIQKSLDETQTLFDSLMQEYFG